MVRTNICLMVWTIASAALHCDLQPGALVALDPAAPCRLRRICRGIAYRSVFPRRSSSVPLSSGLLSCGTWRYSSEWGRIRSGKTKCAFAICARCRSLVSQMPNDTCEEPFAPLGPAVCGLGSDLAKGHASPRMLTSALLYWSGGTCWRPVIDTT
ncbi:hypothetical protein F5883DRAFT_201000 [Diaporthe sp. PMI_573]|nr:hypothetical protein F5883DRAFT_201000 [Diaporthaceae sp. PMI_573]